MKKIKLLSCLLSAFLFSSCSLFFNTDKIPNSIPDTNNNTNNTEKDTDEEDNNEEDIEEDTEGEDTEDPIDPNIPEDPEDPTPEDPIPDDPTPENPIPEDPIDPTPDNPVDPTPVDPISEDPDEPEEDNLIFKISFTDSTITYNNSKDRYELALKESENQATKNLQLSIEDYTKNDLVWTTNDSKVATITDSGLLTFKAGGDVTVSCTNAKLQKDTFNFRVTEGPLPAGDYFCYNYSYYDENKSFHSSNFVKSFPNACNDSGNFPTDYENYLYTYEMKFRPKNIILNSEIDYWKVNLANADYLYSPGMWNGLVTSWKHPHDNPVIQFNTKHSNFQLKKAYIGDLVNRTSNSSFLIAKTDFSSVNFRDDPPNDEIFSLTDNNGNLFKKSEPHLVGSSYFDPIYHTLDISGSTTFIIKIGAYPTLFPEFVAFDFEII